MLESQIWSADSKKDDLRVYFYFDTDNVIIYPEERGGFDRIFGRLHIQNKQHNTFFQSESDGSFF
jgi:hypothetical protein